MAAKERRKGRKLLKIAANNDPWPPPGAFEELYGHYHHDHNQHLISCVHLSEFSKGTEMMSKGAKASRI